MANSLPANISVASSISKSRLSNPDPWLSLIKLTPPGGGDPVHLVRNTVDVLFADGTHFDGSGPVPDTYTAFAWEFAEYDETSDGSLPRWKAKVSNVSKAMGALADQFQGLVGGHVDVYIVQASRLKREPDLELSFDIIGCTIESQWVSFDLGADSFFRIQVGRHLYTADTCWKRYKGPDCKYVGDMPTCSFQLNGNSGCRAHNNALNFGGYPGIDSNGLRIVSR